MQASLEQVVGHLCIMLKTEHFVCSNDQRKQGCFSVAIVPTGLASHDVFPLCSIRVAMPQAKIVSRKDLPIFKDAHV